MEEKRSNILATKYAMSKEGKQKKLNKLLNDDKFIENNNYLLRLLKKSDMLPEKVNLFFRIKNSVNKIKDDENTIQRAKDKTEITYELDDLLYNHSKSFSKSKNKYYKIKKENDEFLAFYKYNKYKKFKSLALSENISALRRKRENIQNTEEDDKNEDVFNNNYLLMKNQDEIYYHFLYQPFNERKNYTQKKPYKYLTKIRKFLKNKSYDERKEEEDKERKTNIDNNKEYNKTETNFYKVNKKRMSIKSQKMKNNMSNNNSSSKFRSNNKDNNQDNNNFNTEINNNDKSLQQSINKNNKQINNENNLKLSKEYLKTEITNYKNQGSFKYNNDISRFVKNAKLFKKNKMIKKSINNDFNKIINNNLNKDINNININNTFNEKKCNENIKKINNIDNEIINNDISNKNINKNNYIYNNLSGFKTKQSKEISINKRLKLFKGDLSKEEEDKINVKEFDNKSYDKESNKSISFNKRISNFAKSYNNEIKNAIENKMIKNLNINNKKYSITENTTNSKKIITNMKKLTHINLNLNKLYKLNELKITPKDSISSKVINIENNENDNKIKNNDKKINLQVDNYNKYKMNPKNKLLINQDKINENQKNIINFLNDNSLNVKKKKTIFGLYEEQRNKLNRNKKYHKTSHFAKRRTYDQLILYSLDLFDRKRGKHRSSFLTDTNNTNFSNITNKKYILNYKEQSLENLVNTIKMRNTNNKLYKFLRDELFQNMNIKKIDKENKYLSNLDKHFIKKYAEFQLLISYADDNV